MLKRKLAVLLVVLGIMGILSSSLPVSASSYSIVGKRTATLICTGAYDVFITILQAGVRYRISTTVPSWADFDLYVFDENLNLVGCSTLGQGETDAVYITPGWTGRFYIAVKSYYGSGSFTVRLRQQIA